MIFLGKMMHAIMVRIQTTRASISAPRIKLLPVSSGRSRLPPCYLATNVAAQDVDIHPSDLFETPQEGIEAPLPRSSREADSWKDYTHLTLNAGVSGESNIFLDNDTRERAV